jgi:hypothetical protein
MIDPVEAAAALARLEGVINSADPEFKPPQLAGLKTALGTFVATSEHKAKALAVGQNVDALVMLARRQIGELMVTLLNIKATIPPSDANLATIESLTQ